MFVVGLIIGALLTFLIQQLRVGSFQKIASKMLQEAECKSKELLEEARKKLLEQEHELACQKQEVEKKVASCRTEGQKLARDREKLEQKSAEIASKLELFEKEQQKQVNFTAQEARELLFQKAQADIEKECTSLLLSRRLLAEQTAEQEAKNLIITALGRISQASFFDQTCTQISLSDASVRAKIIGREGKNIKAFQNATGVTVVLEENFVLLSSFDLERREIAKTALQQLIKEGRIHPDTIVRAVKEASENLEKRLLMYGMEACERARVSGLHHELVLLLGKLSLRSSHGQNLLEHSVEVSLLADLLASELRLDAKKARRIALLHDIGKAAPVDVAPTHALAGSQLARRFGEDEEIANGIGAHHNELAVKTPEAAICKVADALSAARRGARQDHDTFFQKLKQFEQIALQFPAVESAFALQAGKKLHVFVKPECADDVASAELARRISEKIDQLSQGNQVEVTVIRNQQYSC